MSIETDVQRLALATKEWCRANPDVRSVAIVLDYVGDHNSDPENTCSVWLDQDGLVPNADLAAASGMLEQVSKLSAYLANNQQAGVKQLRNEVARLQNSLRRLNNALAKFQQQQRDLEERDRERGRVPVRHADNDADYVSQIDEVCERKHTERVDKVFSQLDQAAEGDDPRIPPSPPEHPK